MIKWIYAKLGIATREEVHEVRMEALQAKKLVEELDRKIQRQMLQISEMERNRR